MSSATEQLKAAGNALFVKNDFSGAYKKYTEALQHDSSNAVLYCNRAACSLGLHRYMDATSDALKATDLNPSYAKAWGRLAAARTGLNQLQGAVDAWQQAVAVLPKSDLKLAEQKQRAQYSAELAAAQKRLHEFGATKHLDGFLLRPLDEDLPWKRALAILPTLTTWESSAWVIATAYQEWDAAVTHMKQGQVVHTPQGDGYFGLTGVIEGLTNALVADERVFHIADQDFFELYKKQLIFEITRFSGWPSSGSRELMEVVPKRLATEGWNSVRPALSVTVRAWIMRAFVEERLMGNCEAALDLLTSALEVLRWGQSVWKDVPYEDKGAIFQPTFVRGVKCLRLNVYMSAYTKERSAHPKYSLDELLAGAQELLDELVGAPTQPQTVDDYAFILAFHRYPTGQAHAIRGFYYNEKARALRGTVQGLSRAVVDLYLEATKAYTEASGCYPPDEESHLWYLHCALQAMWESVGQVKCLLALLDSMKKSIVLVKRIWEFGANWTSGPKSTPGFVMHFEKDMVLRDQLLEKMRRGEINRDSLVSLQGDVIMVIRASNVWA